MAITAGADRPEPAFELPANVSRFDHLELWSESGPGRLRSRRRARAHDLPARLVELLSWDAPLDDVLDALVRCRTSPGEIAAGFGGEPAWDAFLDRLGSILDERHDGAAPAPELDLDSAVGLYRALYWVARTAAAPTPPSDLCHVTAAGWAAIPAVVHRALHGTPLVLTEHGIYVREAYLAAIRSDPAPAERFISTRIARTLARLAYRNADVVAPVARAHEPWERHLSADVTVVHIPNGVRSPTEIVEAPAACRVVSIGRIDPLKDVATLLRLAAEVTRRIPGAEFRHHGPVAPDQQAYARACVGLHAELGLGDRFRFLGSTRTPRAAIRQADVVVLTSISEGFPIAVLEALSEGRPVVATAVGGVAEAVRGCGLVAPPGRVHDLADAVCTLLRDPALARDLGHRGHRRVVREYGIDRMLDRYEDLYGDLLAA